MTPITVETALLLAGKELNAANIRGARMYSSVDNVSLSVHRSFAVEGTLDISFLLDGPKGGYSTRVTVNFPACNKRVVDATAFLGLVQELTFLAASLQAKFDEMKVIEEK